MDEEVCNARQAVWDRSNPLGGSTQLAGWIEALYKNGVAMLTNLDARPGALPAWLTAIAGSPYGTAYGASFTIKSVSEPNNLAYSNLGLGLHTDLPFYSVPPAIQFFHCIHAAETGGESVLCDGFRAALQLSEDHFNVLSTHPVMFYDLTPSWHLEVFLDRWCADC